MIPIIISFVPYQLEKIYVHERYIFENKLIALAEHPNGYRDERRIVIIKRKPRHDTFDMYLSVTGQKEKDGMEFMFVHDDKKVFRFEQNTSIKWALDFGYDKVDHWFANYFNPPNDIDFSKLNLMQFIVDQKRHEYNIRPQKIEFNKNVQSINSMPIRFTYVSRYDFVFRYFYGTNRLLMIPHYDAMYFIPVSPSITRKTGLLAQIYTPADDPGFSFRNLDVTINSYQSDPYGKTKIKTFYKKTPHSKSTYRATDVDYALTGEIYINDYTYYDYEKQKPVIGHNQSVNDRFETFPYHHRGMYWRNLNISFNKIFEDINIKMGWDYQQPILDPGIGYIKLTVDDKTTTSPHKIYQINAPDLKTIAKTTTLSYWDEFAVT